MMSLLLMLFTLVGVGLLRDRLRSYTYVLMALVIFAYTFYAYSHA